MVREEGDEPSLCCLVSPEPVPREAGGGIIPAFPLLDIVWCPGCLSSGW